MPGPKIGPCGGVGQPACPPVPALQINEEPIVIETSDGQKYVVEEDDNDDEQ